MTQTTIKVPRALRDRLKARAVARGLTLAEEIARMLDADPDRPTPTVGGYRSSTPLTAEEIDAELSAGFGQ